MNSDVIDDLKNILAEAKAAIEIATAREAAFSAWYEKLVASLPAISRGENVTLTSDNFRKAMRQAFIAGSSTPNA